MKTGQIFPKFIGWTDGDFKWFYKPALSLEKKKLDKTRLQSVDIKNSFQYVFFEYRKKTPTSENFVPNILFVNSADGPDVLTVVPCTASQVEGSGNSNGFLDSKATLDSGIYRALVECIHHHQQTLQ